MPALVWHMTHPIGMVNYDGFVLGWVLDLPGCQAGGNDLDEVAEWLPIAIAEHIAWLNANGEAAGIDDTWEIAETLQGADFAESGGEFCFEADRAPLARDELATMIARIRYSHVDLLAGVNGLPDTILDWQPPPSSVEAFDSWAPEARTIRGIVEHIVQLEVYYRDGLRDGPAAGIFERVGDPAEERERTLERLRALTAGELARVHRPLRPSRTAAEDWTVRKVLRRLISHERVHTAEIMQRRAWLLLGVPRLAAR